MKVRLRYIVEDTDRHGNVWIYVRMKGKPKIRIKTPASSPDFHAAYEDALRRLRETKPPVKGPLLGNARTLAWLVREFEKSPEFKRLTPRSQRVRRLILESCCTEPTKPGSEHQLGECPLNQFGALHVKLMRNRKVDKKLYGAANNRIRALRVLLAWALEEGHVARNFAMEVKTARYPKKPHHAWTLREIEQFTERHPLGSRARLALSLMLFTGVRRSDAVRLGPHHIRDGLLTFTPEKTKGTTGKELRLLILPELQAVLEASPLGSQTFIETAKGKPFTASGFGNWFRDRCNEAGLPHCSAHGLRSAAATIAAENGATEIEMMSIFGWATSRLAHHYSRTADQKKLAARGMRKLIPTTAGESVPLSDGKSVPPIKSQENQ